MKKNFIRAVCLILALGLGLGLVSCGGAASAPDSSSAPNADSAAESAAPEAPSIPYSDGLDDNGLWKDVKALDYVTLPDYKNFELPAEDLAVTDEMMADAKKNLTAPYGEATKVTDAEVKDGDTVYLNYVGSVDGEEFEGGSTGGNATRLVVGSGSYIPGFEEQIVGHKPGEEFDVNVTFPEDYSDANGEKLPMAGKAAVFKTTVEYIEGDTVYPEFTDEFVNDKLSTQYGWKTVAEADEGIRKDLGEMLKYRALMAALDEGCVTKDAPQSMLDSMIAINLASAKASAAQFGMELGDFVKLSGFADEEAFTEKLTEDAKDAARQQLIFQAIAETEGIQVQDKDIEEAFGENKDKVIETYGLGYVKMNLIADMVSDVLMTEN